MDAAAEGLLSDFEQTVNPGLARVLRFMGLGAVEVTGHGAIIVDHEGREYIDCAGGYGVHAHGYRHPRIVAAAHRQLDLLALSSRVLLNRQMVDLATRLRELTPGDLQYSFFCNSGTEAVEAALKFARAATGRTRLVAAWGGFHGKTFGSLSVSGRGVFRDPFRPLLPDVVHVPYGDADAMAAQIDESVAAVIVEPILGEGGVVVPPAGYLRAVRDLCDRHGALLIADEVQTGMGRTGALFAVEHEGVVPDLLCLAKALGGGIMPIGAVVGRPAAWRFLESAPLLHTSTFGGNPLAAAVAREALDVMVDEALPQRAAVEGAYFLAGLKTLHRRFPQFVKAVRGRGLMIGIEVANPGVAGALINELFLRQVLMVYTLNNEQVLRIIPPLVIARQQIDTVLARLEEALAALTDMGDILL